MNEIISIKNLIKTFEDGRVKALNGVNLQVYEGQFAAIMGRSGSGKSTLLNIIGGIDRPTSGEITVDGIDLCRERNLDNFRSKKVGFVFQMHNLIPVLSASENVQMPMFELKLSPKERIQRAEKLLSIVGLAYRKGFIPPKLSGGEKQRVAIARALANEPKILLADEPTGNLDSTTRDAIAHVFQDLNRLGRTIVLVTHDQEIAEHAQIIHRMKDGRIIPTT